MEAVTKDSDNTEEHESEQVNFQRGMGSNYERLEFIGDCFLKVATSITMFVKHPGFSESEMHDEAKYMLTNKNMLEVARKHEWYKFIRGKAFSRRTWYPHGIKLLEGKGSGTQEQQAPQRQPLGDKTIADVCEALIGASLLSNYTDPKGPCSQFDNAVKAVSKVVEHRGHAMTAWSDYYDLYAAAIPKYQTAPSNASQRDLAEKVEQRHAYHFEHPRLLRSAFLHPSVPKSQENVPSYQRLEFLGDALLDLTADMFLINHYPNKDPGWLTEHKMAMTGNRFLGALSVKLGFHRHMRHNHPSLEQQVRTYAEDIEQAESQARGARDYWTANKEGPKVSYGSALWVIADRYSVCRILSKLMSALSL